MEAQAPEREYDRKAVMPGNVYSEAQADKIVADAIELARDEGRPQIAEMIDQFDAEATDLLGSARAYTMLGHYASSMALMRKIVVRESAVRLLRLIQANESAVVAVLKKPR